MAAGESQLSFNSLLDEWARNETGRDIVITLNGLADILEKETEEYYKSDPDPMDDRHPGRANPTCVLGQLMKTMFRNEEFMNKLVSEYIMSGRETEQSALHVASCRLLLDVLPGLEISVVFQETEGLVARLICWAETADDPLRSYATGLLGGAMEIQDVAANFKEHNTRLVPLMLQRLHMLRLIQEKEEKKRVFPDGNVRHFAGVANGDATDKGNAAAGENLADEAARLNKFESKCDFQKVATAEGIPTEKDSADTSPPKPAALSSPVVSSSSPALSKTITPLTSVSPKMTLSEETSYRSSLKRSLSPGHATDYHVAAKCSRTRVDSFGECSNSSWAEMEPLVIGSYCLKPPLPTTMKQRLILQYLIPMGDYQELLSCVFEHNSMDLIFYYINLRENSDVRLAFEALKYLATLLCHKKFAIEFLSNGGLQRLLQVHRPSIAATGVALCFYYLSYFEDAMERVCLLPEHILSDLVGYVLWLMECSHDSSRCHACMFFSQVFPFRVMLDLFDQREGLRRLFNVISTLEILNVEESSNTAALSEDAVFAMRQAARHVCGALKKYFEAHLAIKADEVRRSHTRNDGSSPLLDTPAYKPLKLTPPAVAENIELLMELLPMRSLWQPEATFHKLGGLQLLVQLVAMAPEWTNYPGKPETIKSALDVITVLTVTPKSQLLLLGNINMPENVSTPAMSVLTGLAEGDVLPDAEVQKAALNIIINCVCGPIERLGGGVGRFMGAGSKKKVNMRIGEDVLGCMWNGVRTNNGIMVLLKLLSVKTPITEADTIRALACRALVGLSRSETVKQILSKLPIFSMGQLQSLMKEPVLQDRRQEHVKFCKYASQLLERVSGKQSNTFDASLEDIRKADIVAQTKIIYQEKELLQLIHDHLLSKGLKEAALTLQKEAGLPRCSTPPLPHPASPHIFSPATPRLTRQHSQPVPNHSLSTPTVCTHSSSNIPGSADHGASVTGFIPTPGPIRFSLHRPSVSSSPVHHKVATLTPSATRSRFLREGGAGSSYRSKISKVQTGGEYNPSLDKIVTEYLRKQHALCRNPVSTCPPMSLFIPHRCPEPLGRSRAPQSVTSRLMSRAINPRFGGPDGAKLNRKFIYNRFLPFQTYRDKEDDGFASCCFSADEKFLMLGTFSGDLKLMNMSTGEEAGSLSCHNSPIIHLEPSRDGKLLLTSSWGISQDSSMWTIGESLTCKYSFDEHLLEFSKLTQDRIVGTKDEVAHTYDVTTGSKLMKLFDPDKANNYRANVATFSPTDELVLNDGVLWDVRSRKPLHKFDKLNQYISGVFHPMGQEIIINSEVWDLRTFKLLHTVPALDQCQIKFNHAGDIIFATRVDEDVETTLEPLRTQFSSTLRTFDATDYSNIGTMDLKTRSIFDLCTDKSDFCLAVIEQTTQLTENGNEESICRLYQIGKLRDEEDDGQEDEDEGETVEEEDEEDEEEDEDPSLMDFASVTDSDGNEEWEDNEAEENAEDMAAGIDDVENFIGDEEANEDDNEDDGNDGPLEFTPSNSEDEDDAQDDNDNDDLDDDMLFALV